MLLNFSILASALCARRLKQVLIIILLVFLLGQLLLGPKSSDENVGKTSNTVPERKIKNIVIWNSHQTYTFQCFGFGEEAFVVNNCKVQNCRLLKSIDQVSNVSEIDAFIVNVNHISSPYQLPQIQRQGHQRFVLFTLESACYMGFSKATHKYGNVFNWTMTYRNNSDIDLHYGRVHRRRVPLQPDHQRMKEPKKLLAWFVSNCITPGKREQLVKELQKYIPVDIYGSCGTLQCPKRDRGWVSSAECYDHLEANYKFYLSFENSLSKDYVTEKLFYILQRRVVPIVYGSADYQAIAPPNSYIDASKYTPKELADYLLLLDKNDTLYEQYFAWKTNYWVESGPEQSMKYSFCHLCQKLHEDEGKVKILNQEDLYRDYSKSTQCIIPK